MKNSNTTAYQSAQKHPEARYPLVISHGHFPYTFDGFREQPPDPNLKCERSERFNLECYNRTEQEEAHRFYKLWTGPSFPRFLIFGIQHANPYYDDSYAVNSANLGPYGDAITYELVPHIEKTFRGLGQGWARFMYGGSTGGWEALAVQVLYPDEWNGCWAACPDPIDFRAFVTTNLYEDRNAYWAEGPFGRVARPGQPQLARARLGHPRAVEPRGARPRDEEPLRRAVRRLGGGLLAGGDSRLPAADHRQAHRGHNSQITVCERGVSFGYNTLISDMRGLAVMRETGCPVVYDATHSVQQPGGLGGKSGGQRQFVPVLARAAVASGIAGLFMETHPDPDCALSDGPNMWPIHRLEELLETLKVLDSTVKQRGFIEETL